MRQSAAICAALLGLAAPSAGWAEGAPVYYRYCSGAVLQMAPSTVGHYKLRVQSGGDWIDYGEAILDEQQRYLALEVKGQGRTTFTPHNCEKVPGICQYQETDASGKTVPKTRINGKEGDIWSYSILENAGDLGVIGSELNLTQIGTVRYGADGFVVEEKRTVIDGYKKTCANRIEP